MRRWSGALAPWSVLVLVEAALYASYDAHDARFHWATHFLVGATAALSAMTLFTTHARRAVRLPWLWVLAAHLFAMFPDVVFEAGHPHEWWMELFLLHIRSHFVPGRNLFWTLTALAALAAYLVAVDQRGRSPR